MAKESIKDYFQAQPKIKRLKIYHVNKFSHEVRYLTPTTVNRELAGNALNMLPNLVGKLAQHLSRTDEAYRKTLAQNSNSLSLPFGFNVYHKKGALTRNNPVAKPIIQLVYMLLNWISPDKDYSAFSINKNRKFKAHFDDKNVKPSIIVSFGSHKSGGGLYIYDENDKTTLYDINRKFLVFDGKNLKHESEGWDGGDRYTLVFYKMTKTPGKTLESLAE